MSIVIQDQEYLDLVRAFADSIGLRSQLDEKLRFLDEYGEHGSRRTRCRLVRDSAPYSFYFVMERRNPEGAYEPWFNGGLIYHGRHDNGGDGSFPTLSVTMIPTHGWSIHT